MSKRTLNIAFGIIVLVAASTWGAVWVNRHILLPNRLKTEDEKWRYDYAHGLLPETSGPYLAKGEISDLKFQVVDLGIAKLRKLSETGDILYEYFGEHPDTQTMTDADGHKRTQLKLPQSHPRIRKADGTLVDFKPGQQVQISETGHIFTVTNAHPDQTGGSDEYTIFRDGKSHFVKPKSDPQHAFSNDLFIDFLSSNFTDHLVLPSNQGGPFIDSKGQKATLPKDIDWVTGYRGSSSGLGSIFLSPAPYDNPGAGRSLLFFKDGKSSTISLGGIPDGMLPESVATGKSCLALSRFNQGPVFVYKDSKFSRALIPQHSITNRCLGINDDGDLIIQSEFLDRESQIPSIIPYKRRVFLVCKGRQYHLVDILKVSGLHPELGQFWENEASLDENGDIVVSSETDDYNHLYILKRVRN